MSAGALGLPAACSIAASFDARPPSSAWIRARMKFMSRSKASAGLVPNSFISAVRRAAVESEVTMVWVGLETPY
jgi:hypothetical protein